MKYKKILYISLPIMLIIISLIIFINYKKPSVDKFEKEITSLFEEEFNSDIKISNVSFKKSTTNMFQPPNKNYSFEVIYNNNSMYIVVPKKRFDNNDYKNLFVFDSSFFHFYYYNEYKKELEEKGIELLDNSMNSFDFKDINNYDSKEIYDDIYIYFDYDLEINYDIDVPNEYFKTDKKVEDFLLENKDNLIKDETIYSYIYLKDNTFSSTDKKKKEKLYEIYKIVNKKISNVNYDKAIILYDMNGYEIPLYNPYINNKKLRLHEYTKEEFLSKITF